MLAIDWTWATGPVSAWEVIGLKSAS
jgi:hypothetical protein